MSAERGTMNKKLVVPGSGFFRSSFIIHHSSFKSLKWLVALTVPMALGAAHAQTFPVKPVRLIVPFVPGGNSDIIARSVAPEMGKALGQQIVIENRGGAGGGD